MKSILFVIDSLTCGGAEKSLVSLLNNINYSKYKVDILLFKRGGGFEGLIPSEVNIIDQPGYFKFLSCSESKEKKLKYLFARVKGSINLRVNKLYKKSKKYKHTEQIIYTSIKNILEECLVEYDIAIAYSQGLPTYFVSDKVRAKKKLAWINCDYVNTLYNKDFDNKYYKKIDSIIAVSEYTRKSISEMNYKYKRKVKMIKDIVDPKLIYKMSNEFYPKEFNETDMKILTVGRLEKVKGYELAIEAAKLLRKNNFRFKWYVVGAGCEKDSLEKMIVENKLSDNFILLGARNNPYTYMRNCDIYVQTSIKEGFGLTVSEAKILKKIVVCTNFDTAYEIIRDNINGFIVNKDAQGIYARIKYIINNEGKIKKIRENLNRESPYNTVNEIDSFYKILES